MDKKNGGGSDLDGTSSETGIQTGRTDQTGTVDEKGDAQNNPDQNGRANGVDQVGEAAGGVAEKAGEAAGELAEGAGQAAGDIVEGAGEAVDDVADGFTDAVDNLGGGSFDSYEDARDYLLGKLAEDNADAHYELRHEKKDLVSYNNNDSDARGYEYSVYETDGNERIGRYYVDKKTGKIFRYMGKNSIEAY